jgi:hypothetical protein
VRDFQQFSCPGYRLPHLLLKQRGPIDPTPLERRTKLPNEHIGIHMDLSLQIRECPVFGNMCSPHDLRNRRAAPNALTIEVKILLHWMVGGRRRGEKNKVVARKFLKQGDITSNMALREIDRPAIAANFFRILNGGARSPRRKKCVITHKRQHLTVAAARWRRHAKQFRRALRILQTPPPSHFGVTTRPKDDRKHGQT